MSVAVFELDGALAPEIPELVVGPWRHAAPRIAAFEAGPEPIDPLESRWRVDLARDDAASQAEFAALAATCQYKGGAMDPCLTDLGLKRVR